MGSFKKIAADDTATPGEHLEAVKLILEQESTEISIPFNAEANRSVLL